MKKTKKEYFVLYLNAFQYDSAEAAFPDYMIYNDSEKASSIAEDIDYDEFNDYDEEPDAFFICKIPYSKGSSYIDAHSNYPYIMNEDLDKDEFFNDLYDVSDMEDAGIDQVYALELRTGEESYIYELSISIDKKYILEEFVRRVIERLKESEISIISEDNEWLLLELYTTKPNLSGRYNLISAKSFDGETLHVHSNSDIAEDLKTICESKNIKLICN